MRISDWSSDVCSSDLLSTALADQADDHDIGLREARHHAEQCRLADAGAGEQAEPLAASDRQQRVDRAHADIERRRHRRTRERIDRSEEHTSELQSLMRNSYAVFCLKKKTKHKN